MITPQLRIAAGSRDNRLRLAALETRRARRRKASIYRAERRGAAPERADKPNEAFAPTDGVEGAEAVLRAIVEILLTPSMELRQLAKEALCKSLDPDPLLVFSSICRADLENVRRTVR